MPRKPPARPPTGPSPDPTIAEIEHDLFVVAILLDAHPLLLPVFFRLEMALEEARTASAAQDRARRILERTQERFTPDADERSGRPGRARMANILRDGA